MTYKIGYAAGAFDLFHVGHLNLLRRAKANCDFLIAGVVSDELLVASKGHGPVIPLAERLEIVTSIDLVDQAVVEDLPDRVETWRRYQFDVFFKGNDWQGTPRGILLEHQFSAVGVDVVYFPYTLDTSSTILRNALDRINATPRFDRAGLRWLQ